jgi:hypothetical protein
LPDNDRELTTANFNFTVNDNYLQLGSFRQLTLCWRAHVPLDSNLPAVILNFTLVATLQMLLFALAFVIVSVVAITPPRGVAVRM